MHSKQDPMRSESGRRLQLLRIAKGFATKRAFAQTIGVEEDRYDKWEKGMALIPPAIVLTLVQRFGITSDWLYFGNESGLTVVLQQDLIAAAARAA
jgi:transcriptional regulator with XRE-family HTH domain